MKTGIVRTRLPKYLFSGLTKCGSCGGGFILSSRDSLRCNNYTARGTCANPRTLKRQDLEARAPRAMREGFFEQGAFDAFCEGFTAELNRFRREHRVQLAAAPREIDGINRRSKQILELMLQGYRNEEWSDELRRLDERKAELKSAIAAGAIDPPRPALHPRMAQVFREKAEALAAAHPQLPRATRRGGGSLDLCPSARRQRRTRARTISSRPRCQDDATDLGPLGSTSSRDFSGTVGEIVEFAE